MAKNDEKKVSYDGLTASDVLAPNAHNEVDEEAAKRAADAGVVDASYVDYDVALKNYEARSDVETLEQRLAREQGRTFSEAEFVRKGESGVAAATADAKPSTSSATKATPDADKNK